MIYQIWSEGYIITEQSSGAIFLGQCEGESFEDACNNYAEKNSEFKKYFDPKNLSHWGCKLFDNEAAARQSFG